MVTAGDALPGGAERRALVIGHFSTVGDVEVLREVEGQLASLGIACDIAPYMPEIAAAEPGWIDIYTADPARYTHLVAVCGPIYRDYLIRRGFDLDRFRHCVRIGVNLTMIDPVEAWNPFDALLERDSERVARPDLSLLRPLDRVPVAGLCFVGPQKEYGARQQHDIAQDHLRRLARRAGLAVVDLDTEWPGNRNRTGFSAPEAFESICARLDVVLTTRLHGMVLSLKNGVPAIAVDAIRGGGKVSQQAAILGWPEVYRADDLDDAALDAALARCLDPAARQKVGQCVAAARAALQDFPRQFAQAVSTAPQGKPAGTAPAPPARTSRPGVVTRLLRRLRRWSLA